MKTVDRFGFAIVAVWFVLVLIYLPVMNVSSGTACANLMRMTSGQQNFLPICEKALSGYARYDLVWLIILSNIMALIMSIRLAVISCRK